ncbi:MAG TPA: 3-oxoacyl-ACP reductase FabG [Syntrophales bacterium]|jgi:3-oxoacyl-[acyl-carrier protein] reductase|nr:3-oxoacyl-ACP reductase FabG [Syntrophales bacterium]
MMEERVALVTGGSRGIGRAIAVELSRAGYRVIVTYKENVAAAEETLALIRSEGGQAEAVRFDVADSSESAAAMEDIFSRHREIQVLVNNAGITADGLFMMMSEENWDKVIQTTLKGFFNVTRPVVQRMVRNHRGSVVSISSVSAMMGNRGQANYAAAKSGLIAASRTLSTEVARLGVRVNVVAPGLIDTEMIKGAPVTRIKEIIPMGRLGKAEEVAKVVRFLCSDDASYLTGQAVFVDGGMY